MNRPEGGLPIGRKFCAIACDAGKRRIANPITIRKLFWLFNPFTVKDIVVGRSPKTKLFS